MQRVFSLNVCHNEMEDGNFHLLCASENKNVGINKPLNSFNLYSTENWTSFQFENLLPVAFHSFTQFSA